MSWSSICRICGNLRKSLSQERLVKVAGVIVEVGVGHVLFVASPSTACFSYSPAPAWPAIA